MFMKGFRSFTQIVLSSVLLSLLVTLTAHAEIIQKQIIAKTLKTSESIRKAAKTLGVSHTTLLNKLKKHKITMEKN